MADTKTWAFIENGQISMIIEGMPRVWRNIYSIRNLTLRELSDLSWAGHPGVRVLPVVFNKPQFNEVSEYVEGPFFTIAEDLVYGDYDVLDKPLPILTGLNTIGVADLTKVPRAPRRRRHDSPSSNL